MSADCYRHLKKSAVILLLALIFLQTGGYYFIFWIDVAEAKREAEIYIKGAESSKAVTLTFAIRDGKVMAPDLVFNDDNEFSYQGRMYDVISTEKTKDHITFRCYSDNKETEIARDISDRVDADRNAPAQKHKEMAVFKMLLQYLPAEFKRPHIFATYTSTMYFLINSRIDGTAVYRAIVSPPPELIHA